MEKKDKIYNFAQRIVNTIYEDLSEEERLSSKLSLLDLIGVTLAGTTQGNMCQKLVQFAQEQGGKENAEAAQQEDRHTHVLPAAVFILIPGVDGVLD